MRTTLVIDDDVLQAVKSVARTEGKSVGAVVTELIRRGLEPRLQQSTGAGFPVFEVSAGAAPITLETVQRGLENDG